MKSLLPLYGFSLVCMLACCSQPDAPICPKQWTTEEEWGMAKQEKSIPEGSPVALELLDYARLRREVARYCQ